MEAPTQLRKEKQEIQERIKDIETLQNKLTFINITSLCISTILTIQSLNSKGELNFSILFWLSLCALVCFGLSKILNLKGFEQSEDYQLYGKYGTFKIIFTEIIFGFFIGYWLYGDYSLFGEHMKGLVASLFFYLTLFVIYHNGEFFFVLWCHPKELGWKSFLIYHSREYMIAMNFSHLEFLIESYFFPSFKSSYYQFFIICFAPIALIGVVLRLSAFKTARSNFHHLIRYQREADHKLITNGVYTYERHPGYLGYFIFSITSQILVKNFVSALGFCIVLWRFFLNRIVNEEHTLIYFFGMDYIYYKKRTKTNIPFINSRVDKQLEERGIQIDGEEPK